MGATRVIGESGILAEVDATGALLTTPRQNRDITVLPLAARTATVSSADIINQSGRSAIVYIRVTATAGAPSVVFTIEGRDGTSGDYYPILASTAVTATGTRVLRVGPGLIAAANLTVNDVLPRTWRVTATHGNADSFTASVGASVVS